MFVLSMLYQWITPQPLELLLGDLNSLWPTGWESRVKEELQRELGLRISSTKVLVQSSMFHSPFLLARSCRRKMPPPPQQVDVRYLGVGVA